MKTAYLVTGVVVLVLLPLAFTVLSSAPHGPSRSSTSTISSNVTSSLTSTSTVTTTVTETKTFLIAPGTVTQTTTTTVAAFGFPSIDAVTVANITVGRESLETTRGVAVNPFTNLVYVPFSSNLTVIDGSTNRVTDVIPMRGGASYAVANPTTNRIYVNNASCGACKQSLLVIDGASNHVVANINLGNSPNAIDVNPNTNTIYATTLDDLFIINGTTNAVIVKIPILPPPGLVTGPPPGFVFGVAVNPKTNMVYVPACMTMNTCAPALIHVINGTTGSVVAKIPIDYPGPIATNSFTDTVYMTVGNSLITINGTSYKQITTRLSAYPLNCYGLSVVRGINEIYVSCMGERNLPSVFIVDGEDNHTLNCFADNGSPWAVAFNSSNGSAYLLHKNGYVLVLSSVYKLRP